jgi:hypothetical protein
MRSAFLTGSRRTTDDRRAANCLMTVIAIAVGSPPTLAQADERAPPSLPPSLIERAQRNAVPGGAVSDRAIAASAWIPELRLDAIVERHVGPDRGRVETIVFGELAWPLGRSPGVDLVTGARARRLQSAARDSLVERILAAWHQRRAAADATDEVAARLAEEEDDAILDAIVGDGDEDAP